MECQAIVHVARFWHDLGDLGTRGDLGTILGQAYIQLIPREQQLESIHTAKLVVSQCESIAFLYRNSK